MKDPGSSDRPVPRPADGDASPPAGSARVRRRTPAQRVLKAIGLVLFGIGFVGLFLPVLPTTGFWIGAVWCFSRSEPALAERIRSWPGVGPAIVDYLDHGVMSPRAKGFALGGLSGAALVILLLTPLGGWAKMLVMMVLALVALYLMTRPSRLPAGLTD